MITQPLSEIFDRYHPHLWGMELIPWESPKYAPWVALGIFLGKCSLAFKLRDYLVSLCRNDKIDCRQAPSLSSLTHDFLKLTVMITPYAAGLGSEVTRGYHQGEIYLPFVISFYRVLELSFHLARLNLWRLVNFLIMKSLVAGGKPSKKNISPILLWRPQVSSIPRVGLS